MADVSALTLCRGEPGVSGSVSVVDRGRFVGWLHASRRNTWKAFAPTPFNLGQIHHGSRAGHRRSLSRQEGELIREMGRRHYPSAVIIHVPHCVEGQSLPALPIGSVPHSLPNHRLHFCFPLELVEKSITEIAVIGTIPMITWETPAYPDHEYVPDKDGRQLPADAIDYPCRICRGTHGQDLEELHRVLPEP